LRFDGVGIIDGWDKNELENGGIEQE